MVHLHTLDCAAGEELGSTEEFLRLLGRGFPRATPGRSTLLESEPDSGALRLEAESDEAGGVLVLWTPTAGDSHELRSEGLSDLLGQEVPGGRWVSTTVTAAGDYSLEIVPR